jgi:RHS repeat-associated protein
MHYTYEAATSRLLSTLDAKNQSTNYQYFVDNTLKQISYTNAQVATPAVTYTYDPNINRVATMTDGTGLTTYAYNAITVPATLGAGRLASVDGPLADDTITFGYDELGRATNRSINSTANAASAQYDSIGRMQSVTNVLGTFAYSYVNATGRLDHVDYPNGQKAQFDYFGNTGDQRLKQIKNLDSSAAVISQFDYTYNPVGNIATWTQANSGQANPRRFNFEYDGADQLRGAGLIDTVTQASVTQHEYDYDAAGNRTLDQLDSTVSTYASNDLNQITSRAGGGKMHFRGTVNEPSAVTVGGTPASVDGAGNFNGTANVSIGTNTVAVVATDANGNTRTDNYQVTTSDALATFTYDLNGNLINDGSKTYEWDATDRLVGINIGTHRTEIEYDGLARRVHLTEKDLGNVTSEKRFLWCGNELCEERNASGGTVTKRFFPQGEERIGGATAGVYFYARDHLGSIREMTDSDGDVRARYDYAPWGSRLKIEGDLDCDFGFTGFYVHFQSGLNFSRTRAYDSIGMQWLSQDPLGEAGGNNLYRYAFNSPVNWTDTLGLLVDAIFSLSKGNITVTDRTSGSTATALAFSGNLHSNDPAYANASGKDVGPLPFGNYDILNFPPGQVNGKDWYSLDMADRIRDDYDPISKRGHFRLHLGTASDGCITVTDDRSLLDYHGDPNINLKPDSPNAKNWDMINNILKTTQTYPLPDATGKTRIYYGNLQVVP